MLGLPPEYVQMEGFLKFDQGSIVKEEMNVDSLSVKTATSICERCENFYEQNGYISATTACADCLKLVGNEDNESPKTVCTVCSLEDCSCQTAYQCAYCTQTFPSTLLLQKHTFVHCDDSNVLDLPSELNSASSERSEREDLIVLEENKECPFCRKQFEMFDPARHSCTARYICHLCGGGLSSAYNLKIHILKHAGDLPYKCEVCTKTFSKPSELTRHLRVHSGIKPSARPGVKSYPCDICSKTFTRPADLRRHTLTHTGTRPFACTMCGLAFSDTSNLKKHITIHARNTLRSSGDSLIDIKTYHCSYCNKMFSRPSELKRHFATHTKTRPFSCDFCGLAFGDASNLRKHVQSHAKTGMRECVMCQVTFDSFEELETHVSSHPNRLPDETDECVKCDICGKTFSSDLYLSGHRAGHTEARPFPCTECLKTFKSLSHLKNHMLTHGGSKGQVCSICGKAFLTRSSLRRHEAIHSRPNDQFVHHLLPQGSLDHLPQPNPNNKSSPESSWGDLCELKSASELPDHSQSILSQLSSSPPAITTNINIG